MWWEGENNLFHCGEREHTPSRAAAWGDAQELHTGPEPGKRSANPTVGRVCTLLLQSMTVHQKVVEEMTLRKKVTGNCWVNYTPLCAASAGCTLRPGRQDLGSITAT